MGHAELDETDIDLTVSPLHGAFKRTWSEFCSTTSIHGLKYTHDLATNRIVRGIWMLLTLVMFACAIVMVITFYLDYRSNPTRMNVENDHAPIESLLFPAVTICPRLLYNMAQSRRYIETLKMPPNANVTNIMDKLTVSYGFINDDDRLNATDVRLLHELLVLNNISTIDFMTQLRWNCTDVLLRCRFQWQLLDCAHLFQITRTFFGYCCSFNLNQTSLNFTGLYSRAGIQYGLSLLLHHNDSSYDKLLTYTSGWKVLLNHHNAFPSAHAVSKFVPLEEEVFMSVRPVETFCSLAVKHLSPEERQCVLSHEYPLTYFPSYVGVNCDLDCRIQNMVKFCGCLTFFFDSNRTQQRICEFVDIPCLVENFADIIGRFRNTQCSCPNNCEMMRYNVELTSAPLQLNAPTVDDFYNGIKKENAVVHIFFNSEVYRRVRRDLLSNMVTLVSNLGSAFSLFVGMSMVSVVEIIYYLTVIFRKHYKQELKAREKINSGEVATQQIEDKN